MATTPICHNMLIRNQTWRWVNVWTDQEYLKHSLLYENYSIFKSPWIIFSRVGSSRMYAEIPANPSTIHCVCGRSASEWPADAMLYSVGSLWFHKLPPFSGWSSAWETERSHREPNLVTQIWNHSWANNTDTLGKMHCWGEESRYWKQFAR
jgi:hypothetical protein